MPKQASSPLWCLALLFFAFLSTTAYADADDCQYYLHCIDCSTDPACGWLRGFGCVGLSQQPPSRTNGSSNSSNAPQNAVITDPALCQCPPVSASDPDTCYQCVYHGCGLCANPTGTSCINPFSGTCPSGRWEFCPLKDPGAIFSLTMSIVTLVLGFIIVFSFIAFPSLRHRNPPNHVFLVVVILEILANMGRILGTIWRQTNAFNASNPRSFLRLQLFIAMNFVSLAAQSVLCIVYVTMAITCAWGIQKAQVVGAIGTILSLGISVGLQVSVVYDVESGRLSTGNLQPWVFYATIVPSMLIGLISVGYIVRAVFYMRGKTKEKKTILVRLIFLLPQLGFCILFAVGANLESKGRDPMEAWAIFVGIPLMGLIEALLFLIVEKVYLRIFYRCCGSGRGIEGRRASGGGFGAPSAVATSTGYASLSEPLNAPSEAMGPGITICVSAGGTAPTVVVEDSAGTFLPTTRRMSQRPRRLSQERRFMADSAMERPRSPSPTSADPLVVPSLAHVLAGMGKGELPPPTSGNSSREQSSMMLMTGNSGVGLSSPYLDEGETLLERDGSQS